MSNSQQSNKEERSSTNQSSESQRFGAMIFGKLCKFLRCVMDTATVSFLSLSVGWR
jgi:hypothetical protein